MANYKVIVLFALVFGVIGVDAFSESNNQQSIIGHITLSKKNSINQPVQLGERLRTNVDVAQTQSEQSDITGQMAGYRILIFSDNNTRTAKSEARAKARKISTVFPHYRTYVTYNSPYWRLKVGDFRTNQDATKAMEEIKKEFPTYSREIRIVRDRINITE